MRNLIQSAVFGMTLFAAGAVQAQDLWSMSCNQLWMERNSIYKAHGYCFKTRPAIATFGNEGCYVDDERDIRFTPGERRLISEITLVERSKVCR
jgi:hypothetical protein